MVMAYVKLNFLATLRSSLSTYLLEGVFVINSRSSNGVIASEVFTQTPLLLVKLPISSLNFVHVQVHGATAHIRRDLGPQHVALCHISCIMHVGASSVRESRELSLVLWHKVRLLLHLSW